MSSRLFVPDNTVLVNFAQIGRMDLLRLIAAERSTWCYTVSVECANSSVIIGLEQLSEAPEIFGDPLMLNTKAEHSDTQVFRARLRKPGDGPSANLGEAESLSIILNRQLEATFITDDNGALGFAAEQGISYMTTWDLLKLFVRVKRLDRNAAWQYILDLGGNKRRYKELWDKESFYAWVENSDSLYFVP